MQEVDKKSHSKDFSTLLSSLDLYPGTGLFLASFVSLFLELLLIRWVPSHMRIVAYYGNLMLLSSFLGLGCGALVERWNLRLHRWFAVSLLLLIVCVFGMKGMKFQQGPDEIRFLFSPAASTTTYPVVFIFILNVLVFVPLGNLIGSYFQRMRPLWAYTCDIGGAITGTAVFGLFSYFWFSPILGFSIVMVAYLFYCRGRIQFALTVLLFLVTIAIVVSGMDKIAIWSPYNHITVKELGLDGRLTPVSAPVRNIGSQQDPPFYVVQVNQDFYMYDAAIDYRRYMDPTRHPLTPLYLAELYVLPHLIRPGAKDVLVVGAGTGMDVGAALLSRAEHVDAVEIDPVIIQIGHRYSASQSYKDPRVSIHNTDARAFFKKTSGHYDMVVFGFLDSQTLFSQMSNIRLDGYVYTRESFREAFGLLRQGGLLTISFYSAGKTWLVDRLVTMVRSATDTVPLIYYQSTGQVIILAGKGYVPQGPSRFTNYRRMEWVPQGTPEAIDDWPYLYLKRQFIPLDYLITIGVLLAISLIFIFLSSGKKRGLDLHFFFLGVGFLLLETKSITTISLYFGTTWLVSMVVILGVLIMVLCANLVATRIKQFSMLFYLPLIASVAFLYFFPTEAVLAWGYGSTLLFSLIVIPLPIFFAGLIFSCSFRESPNPSFSFGSNLVGAMVGGFLEYLGMITGTNALLLFVLIFYLLSFLARFRGTTALPTAA